MSELTGTIAAIHDTQEIGTFTKREFWLKTEGDYPQTISIEFTKDKCSLLDAYAPGQQVKVYYNLRGREWTNQEGKTRVFNTIQGWKIEAVGEAPQGNYTGGTAKGEPTSFTPAGFPDDGDELPF
jgi:single-strand DNA-binding protein